MGTFQILQDGQSDVTVLSNIFIDQYMPEANDAQLKIYLFLLRAINSGSATSISQIADQFNYTEKDVIRALAYWEKKELLAVDKDSAGNPIGIHILSFPSVNRTASKEADSEKLPSAPDHAEALDSAFKKPTYTSDDLTRFKSDEATSQVLFITEQYLKKTLSPSEISTMLYITDRLGFSTDLIDYLVQYCVERGKREMRYIEKVALNWAEEEITTVKQAANYVYKYDKTVYQVMNALGKSASPTKPEIALIKKWMDTYGFSYEIIAKACEKTVLTTDKNRFQYADGILTNWYKAGYRSTAEIERRESGKKQNQSAAKKVHSSNKFNQFQQNDYDFAALERDLLSN